MAQATPFELIENKSPADSVPLISIIIDDLGDHWQRDYQALQLPGAVTYAILPHTPYALPLSLKAADLDKEIILHMPMEPVGSENMGPGGLSMDMSQHELLATLHDNFRDMPNIVGMNNHMGSRLTQSVKSMRWIMEEMGQQYPNFYFIDSVTSINSVAHNIAEEYGIAHASRDIFLDHDRNIYTIARQFEKLLDLAKKQGTAVAIGHPYPETLEFLEYWLPRLGEKGVKLVPTSTIVEKRQRNPRLWHASLSRSPRAVKSLKQ